MKNNRSDSPRREHKIRPGLLPSLLLIFIFQASLLNGQSQLTPKQIAQAEALGKKTELPMKLGTLVHAKNGQGIQAFITTPEQRVAYAVSDTTSSRGSGSKDVLADELHLNRLRITGIPFPMGANQHNSRKVTLCEKTGKKCVLPAHQVMDIHQVVAEFEMPAVLALAAPSGILLVRIEDDSGHMEPEMTVSLNDLKKKTN